MKANFFESDYRVDLTYDDEHLPSNEEEADKLVNNFLRKIKRERAKLGLGPLRYIWINEGFDGEGRPHHHFLINGGLSRDAIEGMWVKGRGKNAKKIGYTCAERLHFNNEGIVGLVKYMTKQHLKKRTGNRELRKDSSPLRMRRMEISQWRTCWVMVFRVGRNAGSSPRI